MTRNPLVVVWRGRRFLVEPIPGGVSVEEEGIGPATCHGLVVSSVR